MPRNCPHVRGYHPLTGRLRSLLSFLLCPHPLLHPNPQSLIVRMHKLSAALTFQTMCGTHPLGPHSARSFRPQIIRGRSLGVRVVPCTRAGGSGILSPWSGPSVRQLFVIYLFWIAGGRGWDGGSRGWKSPEKCVHSLSRRSQSLCCVARPAGCGVICVDALQVDLPLAERRFAGGDAGFPPPSLLPLAHACCCRRLSLVSPDHPSSFARALVSPWRISRTGGRYLT